MMLGLGYRQSMKNWELPSLPVQFYEVAPENWVDKNLQPLHICQNITGQPVRFHGVALNLGGTTPLDMNFLKQIRVLIKELGVKHYSDHLAASGDTYHLYDLFPIPFTLQEAKRVAKRIQIVQEFLGMQMAVENSTWYANIGDMSEVDFICEVLDYSGALLLLDINNILVNYKNHQLIKPDDFIAKIDMKKVSYVHIAGHEYDARFEMFLDTHSQKAEEDVKKIAKYLQKQHDLDILLEWDNDIPDQISIHQELTCLQHFLNT